MTKTNLDWTHKNIRIVDIRKVNKLYVLIVNVDDFMNNSLPKKDEIYGAVPLFVSEKIFEERLKSYFLKEGNRVSREEILGTSWNMYITKGYYIKVLEDGTLNKCMHDSTKYYISYLEIAGELGSFLSIYNNEKE